MSNYWIYENQFETGDELYQGTTPTFSDIFPSFDAFKTDYEAGYLPTTISAESLKTLYALLLGKYAIEPVGYYYDGDQFKIRVFSIIFQFGPAWEKRLETQKIIRDWTEEDIINGYLQIHNTSLNPSTKIKRETTQNDGVKVINPYGVVDTINQQNTAVHVKDKMSAYAMWLSMLEEDVSEPFLERFRPLFSRWYDTNPVRFKSQNFGGTE